MSENQNAPAVKAGAVRQENSAGTLIPIASSVGRGAGDVPPADYRQATTVWARAAIRALAAGGPLPEYGTADWLRLPSSDPHRYGALIVAAEQSRRTRTPAERAAQRATSPAQSWPLRATPGWPPVAIPGAPGHYLEAA